METEIVLVLFENRDSRCFSVRDSSLASAPAVDNNDANLRTLLRFELAYNSRGVGASLMDTECILIDDDDRRRLSPCPSG